MTTPLKTPNDFPFTLTRFWGGTTKGVSINVSMGFDRSINLTREDAKALAETLRDFANGKEKPAPS